MADVGLEGDSRFQRECLAAFERACLTAGQPLPRYERVDDGDPYFTGVLADGRTFFVYVDEAHVGERRLEEWGFVTPVDLIAAFVAESVPEHR